MNLDYSIITSTIYKIYNLFTEFWKISTRNRPISIKELCYFVIIFSSGSLPPESDLCHSQLFSCFPFSIHRSSRSEVFCKKGARKNFSQFTGNTCARASFLLKLQAWGLQLYYKGDSGTYVFMWISRNF